MLEAARSEPALLVHRYVCVPERAGHICRGSDDPLLTFSSLKIAVWAMHTKYSTQTHPRLKVIKCNEHYQARGSRHAPTSMLAESRCGVSASAVSGVGSGYERSAMCSFNPYGDLALFDRRMTYAMSPM